MARRWARAAGRAPGNSRAQTGHAPFERFAAAVRISAGRGSVTIPVSHRFSTVRMADLIVVLAKGRIVERGSRTELMALRGLSPELYSRQVAAFN